MTRKSQSDDSPIPGGGSEAGKQRRLYDAAREDFLTKVPLLSSHEVGDLLGSKAKDRSAVASRLKREGKLLAVRCRGVDMYPAFQIVDGRPLSAIEEVLGAFRSGGNWTAGLWLRAPSGWLGGERPLDLIRDEPERVVSAAHRTAAPTSS